jgi:xylulokinase
LQADVYESEVAMVNSDEGPAFGAALIAGVGAGVYTSISEAVEGIVSVAETIQPTEESSIYDERYQTFISLYPALKNTFEKIHQQVN